MVGSLLWCILLTIAGAAAKFEDYPLPPFPLEYSFRNEMQKFDAFAEGRGLEENEKYKNSHNIYILHGPVWKIEPDIGRLNLPAAQIRYVARSPERLIYDVIYTNDPYGRRYNWVAKDKNVDRHVVLLGCSFTYGEAVSDRETISHYISAKGGRYYAYNYGMRGAGPHGMLALLESDRFKKQIPEDQGLFVYVSLGSDHVERATGRLPSVTWGDTPYYHEKNGRLVHDSTFRHGRWLLTHLYLLYYYVRDYIGLNNDHVFPRLFDSDYDLVCKMTKAMQKKVLQEFPKSQFLVYEHGLVTPSEKLEECYRKNNIPFMRGIHLPDIPGTSTPIDLHPTAKANELVADEILNYARSHL